MFLAWASCLRSHRSAPAPPALQPKSSEVAPGKARDGAEEAARARKRVVDHGEVSTPPGLVRDMLDLPGGAEECPRMDSRFLKPACGDGNFLAAVLRRRLCRVSESHPKHALIAWAPDALQGLANLYGIELLADNAARCLERIASVFEAQYTDRFKTKAREAVTSAAKRIPNILRRLKPSHSCRPRLPRPEHVTTLARSPGRRASMLRRS